MIDINKHKFLLIRILKDIFSDTELAASLGFKGGTALMFFYDLPRFSVDLDFNLIFSERVDSVYSKIRDILLKYGSIHDEAKKFYGLILVLNYGTGERKLKLEISNRNYGDRYELKNLLGINMKVMEVTDMFAHKLCALLDRTSLANRDIFDCWFFMERQTPINKRIVETRMNMSLTDYLQLCIDQLEKMSDKGLLHGMGELMDNEMKKFVRTRLRSETLSFLHLYKNFPILADNY